MLNIINRVLRYVYKLTKGRFKMEQANSKETPEYLEHTGVVELPDPLVERVSIYCGVIGETMADFTRRSIDEEYRAVVYDQGVFTVDNARDLGITYEIDESVDLRKVFIRLGDKLVALANLALLTNSPLNAVLSQALLQRCLRVEQELPQYLEAYEDPSLREIDESFIKSVVDADKPDTDTSVF